MKDTKRKEIQRRDTCLALTFLFLLIWFFYPSPYLVYAAMGMLLLGMICPKAMHYPAKLWFGLAHALGSVMSKVLLTLIYILFLLPVGMVRRLMGKDAMQLKRWHQGSGSVFVVREHKFTPEDLKNPY